MATTTAVPFDFDKFAVFIILKQPMDKIIPDVIPHTSISKLHGIAVLGFQEVAVKAKRVIQVLKNNTVIEILLVSVSLDVSSTTNVSAYQTYPERFIRFALGAGTFSGHFR